MCAEGCGRGAERAPSTSLAGWDDGYGQRDVPRDSDSQPARLCDLLTHLWLCAMRCAGGFWMRTGILPRWGSCMRRSLRQDRAHSTGVSGMLLAHRVSCVPALCPVYKHVPRAHRALHRYCLCGLLQRRAQGVGPFVGVPCLSLM